MKRILVTGASGLIGQGIVRHLLDLGYGVIGTAKTRSGIDLLEKFCESCDESGKFIAYQIDLCAEEEIDQLICYLAEQQRLPTGLINNARSLENVVPLHAGEWISKNQFIKEYDLGVFAPYNLSLKLASAAESPLSHIVNIGSQYGVTAFNRNLYEGKNEGLPIHYSVAKAALIHLTKELAILLQPKGIYVNCLSLGGVRGRANEELELRYGHLSPSKSMLDVDDIKAALDFLLSENIGACVGHNLVLDGGWTLW